MNVLIYGASNVIAIGNARVLSRAGHRVILSGTSKLERAFFSIYCNRKYLFRNPLLDRTGFVADLVNCVEHEAIELIVPTTGQALLDLVAARDFLGDNVVVPFPLDDVKIKYVSNKENLPEICKTAGVRTPTTCGDKDISGNKIQQQMVAPVVLKRATGQAGEGFFKIERLYQLGSVLAKAKQVFPGDEFLVQKFIEGKVYGAGAVFDGQKLHSFYSYEYVKRYPSGGGSPTVCRLSPSQSIRTAMEKVLVALEWQGYCHMDFIVDQSSHEPYLIDINPVHWYTIPFSSSEDLNCLFYFVGEEGQGSAGDSRFYTTMCLTREFQRILVCGIRNGTATSSNGKSCCDYLAWLRKADFFFDPVPIVAVPILKLLRYACRCHR